MATGYSYHEIFGWHDTSSYAGVLPSNPAAGLQPFVHMENAETKRRIHELVVVSGLIDHLVRIARGRRPTRRSCASTRLITWLASSPRACCPRAATPATGSRRSARVASRSPAWPPAPSSSASTRCWTGGSTTRTRWCDRRAPRDRLERHGILHLRQRGDRRCPRPCGARGGAGIAVVDWDVHHGNGTPARSTETATS